MKVVSSPRINSTTDSVESHQSSAIVIGLWQDQPLGKHAQEVDRLSGGRLTALIESENVTCGKLDLSPILNPTGMKTDLVLVVGLGPKEKAEPGLDFQVASAASKFLAKQERKSISFFLDDLNSAEAIAGSMVGCVGQDLYRKEKSIHTFEEIIWATDDSSAVQRGTILGQSVNLTRQLVNEPANKIYPISFAKLCIEVGKESGFEVEVWDEDRLRAENCGAMLAVAQASENSPRIVIMRHNGSTPNGGSKKGGDQIPLALVGKGVTFDSGGLSLKPSDSMLDMKCDMAGAATVVGAMKAIAEMNLPINVVGMVGLAENMISGNSYRLGDVLTARSGKTIEVHNTDAEGRLVLADVLNVAVENKVERIIDLATLTGACMVALGRYVAGFMTNDQDWCDQVLETAKDCGEPAWQLPMFQDYNSHIKSDIADIKNVGDSRWGGAITAAKFLEEFVDETTWVHMDIAGPSFQSKPNPWIDAGASGCFVRTLFSVAERLASGKS